MPSLKDLRNRIRSVRSTQKITSAMKMVAASRLRRAQEQAEAARPHAHRGLAGGFNAPILREARRRIRELDNSGKTVKILTIGRKGRDSLRRDYARLIHDSLTEIGRRRVSFEEARDIAGRILALFEAGEFDVCTIIFNRFRSAMTQIVTAQQLIPFATPCGLRCGLPSTTSAGL